MDLTAKNIFKRGFITYFLNYDQTKEVRTKILGLKVFAYIVEEARGANSNFKILVCSPLVWLARRASLKQDLDFLIKVMYGIKMQCNFQSSATMYKPSLPNPQV